MAAQSWQRLLTRIKQPGSWRIPIARSLLFLIFAMWLYQTQYRPATQSRIFDKGSAAENQLKAAAIAANAGYPFQYYFHEGQVDPQKLIDFNSIVVGERGLPFMIALSSVVGRVVIGSNFAVNTNYAAHGLFVLLLLSAVLILFPSVPLLTSVAGIVSLYGVIAVTGFGINSQARLVPAYMVVLIGVLIATVYLPLKRRWRVLFLLGMGLVIGFVPFLREESGGIVYSTSALLMGGVIIFSLVGWFVLRSQQMWREIILHVAARVVVTVAVMLGGILFVNTSARVFYSIAWRQPFSETVLLRRGIGHPLYMSLGFVSNPFNIGWKDQISQIHIELMDPTIPIDYTEPFQDRLIQEWFGLVSERPQTLVENTGQKLAFIHALFTGKPLPTVTYNNVVNRAPLVQALYYPTCLLVLVAAIGMIRWAKPSSYFLCLGFLGIVFGAIIIPLIIFPSYVASLQGLILCTTCLLPAVVIDLRLSGGHSWSEPANQQLRRITRLSQIVITAAFLGLALLGLIWYMWRMNIHNDKVQAITQTNPLTDISDLQFRYAHLFNDLPAAAQERILGDIRNTQNTKRCPSTENSDFIGTQIGKFVDVTGNIAVFRPVVAVLTGEQVHIFAWFGKAYPEAPVQLDQGRVDASIYFTDNDAPDRIASWEIPINNVEWRDTYRMVSRFIPASILRQKDYVDIELRNPTPKDPQNPSKGIDIVAITKARIVFCEP